MISNHKSQRSSTLASYKGIPFVTCCCVDTASASILVNNKLIFLVLQFLLIPQIMLKCSSYTFTKSVFLHKRLS